MNVGVEKYVQSLISILLEICIHVRVELLGHQYLLPLFKITFNAVTLILPQ